MGLGQADQHKWSPPPPCYPLLHDVHRFLNKRNICGFSALHYAIWRGHVAVVRLLLNSGADTNHANDRVFDPCVPVPIGSTPMHLAVVQNNSTIVLMLLEHYVSHMFRYAIASGLDWGLGGGGFRGGFSQNPLQAPLLTQPSHSTQQLEKHMGDAVEATCYTRKAAEVSHYDIDHSPQDRAARARALQPES